MKTFCENEEMTAMNYQNHRLAPNAMLEPTTAKYLLDFIYFTRDDEQFRFYKKVSKFIFAQHNGKIFETDVKRETTWLGQKFINFLETLRLLPFS